MACEVGEREPGEGDVALDAGWRIGPGEPGAAELFHAEQGVDLVAIDLAVVEGALVDQEWGADAGVDAHLFEDLALEGGGGGFAEVDVAAGEVVVAALFVLAHQDAGVVAAAEDGDASCDDLDVA